MAIEDALVLADCLERYQTIDAALRAYETERYPRTAKVTNLSWRLGSVAQVENPIAYRLRNALVRLTPDSVSQRQTLDVVDWDYPARSGRETTNGR
jgi:2-polyprenyl-6-methoxyphenol hydroxylase-like FAD-dependent oxidoreductase